MDVGMLDDAGSGASQMKTLLALLLALLPFGTSAQEGTVTVTDDRGSTTVLAAQYEGPPTDPLPQAAPEIPQEVEIAVPPLPGEGGRHWTSLEIVISVGILVFALVVLGLEAVIMLRAQPPWHAQQVMRVFGLTLILTMSVFLIGAGYSENQTAPAMGLLGVVAGYLLGNQGRESGRRPPRRALKTRATAIRNQ